MAVFKRGSTYWYKFQFEGQSIRESAKTTNKEVAKRTEEKKRRDLRDAIMGTKTDERKERARVIRELAEEYFAEYKLRKNKSATFVEYALRHVVEHLGKLMVSQIDIPTVKRYQTARTNEGASPKTINGEVILLLRIMEDRGDQLREELKRKRQLHLKVRNDIGKAFSVNEQDRLLAAARESKSPNLYFALELALNGGMRDGEIKSLTWAQVDFTKNLITIGESKTAAGTGRLVPLNGEVLEAFTRHREWYTKTFGELRPSWYIFAFGRKGALDPTRGVTTFKTAWTKVRGAAGVKGRWHDTRHTVVTQLGESGASPTTIMASVGHVSRRMLDRYSHANIDAQKRAFEQMTEYRNRMREKEQRVAAHAKAKQHEAHATVN